LVVPKLADWYAIDLVSDDLTIQQTVVAHSDPAKVALAGELRKRFPVDPKSAGLKPVFVERQSQLIPEITHEMIVSSGAAPDYIQVIETLGLSSSIIVPIIGYTRVLGMISLISDESGRHYDPKDLALTEELARRVAVAVENAQLYREAQ